MLKYAVLFVTVFCLVQSQRPWHAGSPNRLPMVLPQYLDERAAATQAGQVDQTIQASQAGQAAQAGQTAQAGQAAQAGQGIQPLATGGTPLDNRIDVGASVNASVLITTTMNPLDLPVDAHGDIDLINRIKTWPRDKQPFWYLNWQAIQAHRGDVNNSAQPAQTQPNSRSFFAG